MLLRSFNVDDLLKVLKSISPYLIAIGIELIVLIGLSIYFRKIKLEVSKRKLSITQLLQISKSAP